MTLSAKQGKRRHDLYTGRPGTIRRVRVSENSGIGRSPVAQALNATDLRVLEALDDELVAAAEIAGIAGITVGQCRRALATLRAHGLAEAERRGNVNAWRRA